MPIEWRTQMSIDRGVIDHDRQTLIAVINEFCALAPCGDEIRNMQVVLDKLDEYTRSHFDREEKLQIQVRYPYVGAHHQEHHVLIRKLQQIRAMVDEPAETENEEPHDVGVLRAKVTALLHDWLIDHIIKSDLRMRPYAKSMTPYARQLAPLHTAANR